MVQSLLFLQLIPASQLAFINFSDSSSGFYIFPFRLLLRKVQLLYGFTLFYGFLINIQILID